MTITVSTADPRSVKALEVLASAPRWLKIRRKADGTKFYVIPGSKGVAHWTATDGSGCTCKGYRYRGTCSHVLAVREFLAVERPAPAPAESREQQIARLRRELGLVED